MTITCITPTGDREDSFKEIVTCINNQTVKPDKWIIVDDGVTPLGKDTIDTIEVPYSIIRLAPVNYHSLSRNLLYALDVAPDGHIIIVEDDEWYGPDYIQQRCNELKTVQLTGDRYRYRYSLSNGGTWGISRNSSFSCLHSTAFRSDIKKKVYEAIAASDKHDADVRIWNAIKADNNLTYCVQANTKPYMVTIKAWPTGRAGTMGLHRRPLGNNDKGLVKLQEWLGNDFERYSKYIH